MAVLRAEPFKMHLAFVLTSPRNRGRTPGAVAPYRQPGANPTSAEGSTRGRQRPVCKPPRPCHIVESFRALIRLG
jgi:hypothetical protein